MNGVDQPGQRQEERIFPVSGRAAREQGRQGGCLPVVAVNHVGREADRLAAVQGGFAEEEEALQIVRIVPVAAAVVLFAVEIGLVAQEIGGDRRRVGLPQVAPLQSAAHRDAERCHAAQSVSASRDGAVFGHDRAHLFAEAALCGGQRLGDIGQPAGFGKGGDLRGNK